MLKEEKHFNTAVRYVKKCLPAAHPLVAKGWKRLPAGAHSLSKKQAVPVGQWSDYDSSDEVGRGCVMIRALQATAQAAAASARVCVCMCLCGSWGPPKSYDWSH